MPPAPYYSTARVTLWCGGAEAVLPHLATESVDLVVTDPPYGVGFRSGRRVDKFAAIANDKPADRPVVREVLGECVSVAGQNRHLYVFGPAELLDGFLVAQPAELVWDKGTKGGGALTCPWAPQHERITFAVTKHQHRGQAGTSSLPARMRKGSVLRFTRPTGLAVRHPTEKPVPLLRELIESSSRAGELVLDPFAGVGSTLVAAVLAGRRALGVELDPRYAAIAVERLQAAEALVDKAERL